MQLLAAALRTESLYHYACGGTATQPALRQRSLAPGVVVAARDDMFRRTPHAPVGVPTTAGARSARAGNNPTSERVRATTPDRSNNRELFSPLRRCLCAAPVCRAGVVPGAHLGAVREPLRCLVADGPQLFPFVAGAMAAHTLPGDAASFCLRHAPGRLRPGTLLRVLLEFGEARKKRPPRVRVRRLQRFHVDRQRSDDGAVRNLDLPGSAALVLPSPLLGVAGTAHVLRVHDAYVLDGPLLRDWQPWVAPYLVHGEMPWAYGAPPPPSTPLQRPGGALACPRRSAGAGVGRGPGDHRPPVRVPRARPVLAAAVPAHGPAAGGAAGAGGDGGAPRARARVPAQRPAGADAPGGAGGGLQAARGRGRRAEPVLRRVGAARGAAARRTACTS